MAVRRKSRAGIVEKEMEGRAREEREKEEKGGGSGVPSNIYSGNISLFALKYCPGNLVPQNSM